MKTFAFFNILYFSLTCIYGQERLDSLRETIASTAEKMNVDSISTNLIQLPDTLLPAFQKVDSLRHEFNLAADSINKTYQTITSRIDAEAHKVNGIIDSLNELSLPSGKYATKIDSLGQLHQTTLAKYTSRLNELKAKTTEKLNALDISQ